jgi:hypothetical protein
MFRLKIALLFGGIMLAYFGVQEARVSSGTTMDPAKVELAELENGTTPTNGHVLFGGHVADYAGCVYEYEEGTNKVTHTYYPIISDDHPFFEQLGQLYQKYPNIDDAPEAEFPQIDNFRVLVKTKRFKTQSAIPDGLGDEEKLQGLVINLVESISGEEKKMLQGSFPALNFDNVLIVQEGRKPSSQMVSMGMIGGGGLLSLLGIGSFFMGRGGKSAPPQNPYQG